MHYWLSRVFASFFCLFCQTGDRHVPPSHQPTATTVFPHAIWVGAATVDSNSQCATCGLAPTHTVRPPREPRCWTSYSRAQNRRHQQQPRRQVGRRATRRPLCWLSLGARALVCVWMVAQTKLHEGQPRINSGTALIINPRVPSLF